MLISLVINAITVETFCCYLNEVAILLKSLNSMSNFSLLSSSSKINNDIFSDPFPCRITFGSSCYSVIINKQSVILIICYLHGFCAISKDAWGYWILSRSGLLSKSLWKQGHKNFLFLALEVNWILIFQTFCFTTNYYLKFKLSN